VSTHVQGTLKY